MDRRREVVAFVDTTILLIHIVIVIVKHWQWLVDLHWMRCICHLAYVARKYTYDYIVILDAAYEVLYCSLGALFLRLPTLSLCYFLNIKAASRTMAS